MAHSFITCSFCGKREDVEIFRFVQAPLVVKMRGERLCFECAYWKSLLENPESDTITINGSLYKHIEPLQRPNLNTVRSTSMKLMIDVDTRDICGCRSLIYRGRVPTRFIGQFPNRYKFITLDQYRRIYRYEAEMCLSKGCFDRYHCMWYNAAIAEPGEPWNIIPKNYIIGGENCPSFVNKYDIFSTD